MKKLKRQNKRKFKDKKLGAMMNKTKEMLETFYGQFDRELSEILGYEFSWESTEEHNNSYIKNAPVIDDNDYL
ncbi:Hypothetical predicted protein [Mytilus galloprovincialis]|nr:Hypothetical predicted protein [Mytilus galloprovincialis]